MNRTHRVAILLAACGQLAGLPAAAGRTHFAEDFRNYREEAPLCTEGLGTTVGNDPVWTQRAEANCSARRDGMLFKAFQPAEAPRVAAFDVLFRFRFQSDEARARHLRLLVRGEAGGRPCELRVDLFHDRVLLDGVGITPALHAEAALPVPLVRGDWYDCSVTVATGRLVVRVSEDRVLKSVIDRGLPAFTLAGVNVAVFKDAPFSVSGITVRDPAPLPDHGVARLLPASRRRDTAAFSAGGTHAVPADDRCGASLIVGRGPDTARLALQWTDGGVTELTFGTFGIEGRRRVVRDDKAVMEACDLPDAVIRVGGLEPRGQLQVHVRPMLRRYHTSYSYTDAYHDIVRDWDQLPAASAHPLRLECRRADGGVDLYLDGSLAARYPGKALQGLTFTLTPAAAIGHPFSAKAPYDTVRFLPLDVSALGMARKFAGATHTLQTGAAEVRGVPLLVADGAGSGDVGLVREGQGNWALEVDEYTARSPFDGLLTELHVAVPGGAPYTRAWVLAAVDPDPAKDPILTARLAYYVENGSGNNRLADTAIVLPRPGEPVRAGQTEVGTVTLGNTAVPLLLVEVPLAGGQILDLMMDKPRLSFELLGKRWENFQQIDNTSKPDPASTSSVQVFGVTLERAGVGLAFEQAQPANVFYNDERPETTAILTARAAAAGTLRWSMHRPDGSRAGGGAAAYRLSAPGAQQRIPLPLGLPEPGWYGLTVRLEDGDGQLLVEHPAAFALLGRDTRQAHTDSPFGVWWFDGAHDTPKDLDFAGPVMLKAGIRAVAWTGQKGNALQKYKLFKDQFNMPFTFKDFGTAEELAQEARTPGPKTAAAWARARTLVDTQLRDHPHTREVLMYHESGPGNDVPVELFGLKPDLTPDRTRHEKRYADLANIAGAFFRQHYPQLRTVLGNNSCSAANVAAVLRHGGKAAYIDYIGIEAPSQVYIPEKLQEWALQGHHLATETAEALSGRAIPATGCYEFTYRCERDMGEQQQAEWYARDVLISLANGFTRIGPGILFDTQNAYYNGLWGGSGLLRRGPTGYPKPAYVAYAVITAVFDQVRQRRQLPTGSTTVYAVEFDRADGQHATALWASRGSAEFRVDFGGEAEVTVVGMYGRRDTRRPAGGTLTVTAGTSPAYLLSRRPVRRVALGPRAFPKDAARAAAARVVAPLDRVESIALASDHSLDTPLTAPLQTPVRRAGTFELRALTDAEKGACVELELRTNVTHNLGRHLTEYAVLRLAEPAAVEGAAAGLGVWVRGNSSWGRVLFEIEDAGGEVWRSVGTGGWGCDVLDWPGNAAVNFDGWSFVALPLAATPLFNDRSPGPLLEQWVSGGGDKRIDQPVRVRALIVEMHRTALDLVDFKPVRPAIALRDLSAF